MDTNLNEALKTIQDTARLGDKPHLMEVTGLDADGRKVPAFVAFAADGPGKVKPVSLLPYIAETHAHAERLRLEAAGGPDRRKGVAMHQTLASFIAHMLRFKDGNSAVWASVDLTGLSKLVGVFNYHETGPNGTPRWGDHRAVYPCPLSEAWKAWGAGRPVGMDQDELAEFLEARDYDLANGTLRSGTAAPTPAMLLSVANKLEVYSNASASRSRDQNGKVVVSFTKTQGVSGDVQPPTAFLISVPVFEDAEPELMEVRLRVKVEDAKAVFTLQIHDAERTFRKSFEKVCQQVILDTGLPVYQGTPE